QFVSSHSWLYELIYILKMQQGLETESSASKSVCEVDISSGGLLTHSVNQFTFFSTTPNCGVTNNARVVLPLPTVHYLNSWSEVCISLLGDSLKKQQSIANFI